MTLQRFEQWPDSLRSASVMFHLKANASFGPPLNDGRQQRVQSSAGHWIAEMTLDVGLFDEIRTYMGVINKAAGGVTEFFVPSRRSRLLAPWPVGDSPTTVQDAVDLADGRAFADGRVLSRRVIDIRVETAAAAGASSARFTVLKGSALRRGHAFTVADRTGRKRLHELTEIPRQVSAGVWEVQFGPPLRGPIRVGAQVDFENPSCTMTLADPDSGMLTLEPFMRGNPTVTFRESFNGFR